MNKELKNNQIFIFIKKYDHDGTNINVSGMWSKLIVDRVCQDLGVMRGKLMLVRHLANSALRLVELSWPCPS